MREVQKSPRKLCFFPSLVKRGEVLQYSSAVVVPVCVCAMRTAGGGPGAVCESGTAMEGLDAGGMEAVQH